MRLAKQFPQNKTAKQLLSHYFNPWPPLLPYRLKQKQQQKKEEQRHNHQNLRGTAHMNAPNPQLSGSQNAESVTNQIPANRRLEGFYLPSSPYRTVFLTWLVSTVNLVPPIVPGIVTYILVCPLSGFIVLVHYWLYQRYKLLALLPVFAIVLILTILWVSSFFVRTLYDFVHFSIASESATANQHPHYRPYNHHHPSRIAAAVSLASPYYADSDTTANANATANVAGAAGAAGDDDEQGDDSGSDSDDSSGSDDTSSYEEGAQGRDRGSGRSSGPVVTRYGRDVLEYYSGPATPVPASVPASVPVNAIASLSAISDKKGTKGADDKEAIIRQRNSVTAMVIDSLNEERDDENEDNEEQIMMGITHDRALSRDQNKADNENKTTRDGALEGKQQHSDHAISSGAKREGAAKRVSNSSARQAPSSNEGELFVEDV
jgi:hypothetical protein